MPLSGGWSMLSGSNVLNERAEHGVLY